MNGLLRSLNRTGRRRPLWNSQSATLFSVSLYRSASQSPFGFTLKRMPEHRSASPPIVLNFTLMVPFENESTCFRMATGKYANCFALSISSSFDVP